MEKRYVLFVRWSASDDRKFLEEIRDEFQAHKIYAWIVDAQEPKEEESDEQMQKMS